DVAALSPMVALPGDPGNGVFIADLPEPVAIEIAYGGSCTAGKREGMGMYAAVLADGLAKGQGGGGGGTFWIQVGGRGGEGGWRREGLPGRLREGGREDHRAVVRRLHRGGPGRLDPPGAGDGQRDQPQLPRTQRAREDVPREPVRRRGLRSRRT